MGDRASVIVKTGDSKVYLYTHWTGTELPETLRKALARRLRWDDDAYLTRIIFCQMVKGNEESELGFGISGTPTEDSFIVVDVDNQRVGVLGGNSFTFEQYANKKRATWATLGGRD